MKKFLVVSWCLTLATGLAFANNVAAIVKWWMKFVATGGDSAALREGAGGFLPWLNWSAVDYSGVTTFIPFLGCVFISRGLWRIVRKKRTAAETFPFFPASDQFNVALGLFGTLWGIIVIGYFQLDTVTMADLMQCLHTALFSTLAAVVWVFMIDHPLVRPWLRNHLVQANLAANEDGNLAGVVESFTTQLAAATDAFAQREQEFQASFAKREQEFEASFNRRLAEFEKSFTQAVTESREALEKLRAESEKRFADHQSEMEKSFAIAQGVAVKALNDRIADSDKAMAERQQKYDAALERRIAAYEQEAAQRLAALKAENEAERQRHKAEAEVLAANVEIARAETQKAEEVRAEAVRAAEKAEVKAGMIEAKLKSIRSAMGE